MWRVSSDDLEQRGPTTFDRRAINHFTKMEQLVGHSQKNDV